MVLLLKALLIGVLAGLLFGVTSALIEASRR
jgi:hypothetical protein